MFFFRKIRCFFLRIFHTQCLPRTSNISRSFPYCFHMFCYFCPTFSRSFPKLSLMFFEFSLVFPQIIPQIVPIYVSIISHNFSHRFLRSALYFSQFFPYVSHIVSQFFPVFQNFPHVFPTFSKAQGFLLRPVGAIRTGAHGGEQRGYGFQGLCHWAIGPSDLPSGNKRFNGFTMGLLWVYYGFTMVFSYVFFFQGDHGIMMG